MKEDSLVLPHFVLAYAVGEAQAFPESLLPSAFRLPPTSPGTGRGEQVQCLSGPAVKHVPPRVMVLPNMQLKCKTPGCSSFWQAPNSQLVTEASVLCWN